MDPMAAAQRRAGARMTRILLSMSSAGQAAFYSGEMVLDLGEGWAVQADPYNNTFRLDYSPLRLYQEEQAQLAEREREKRAALAADIGTRPPIPKDVQMFVWQRDSGRCVQCASNQNLEFDHIIPFSMGGSSTARNLQLLCESCNRSKGADFG
jgi:hypothetical protein